MFKSGGVIERRIALRAVTSDETAKWD
jgi:hypothetical protein